MGCTVFRIIRLVEHAVSYFGRGATGRQPGLVTICMALAVALCSSPALAHSPHDDTTAIVVLEGQGQHHVMFAIVRSNLLKSYDGGSSWRRLIRGLDHKHPLSGLATSPDGNTVYVTTLGDGVYRSSDGGHTFENVSGNLGDRTVDIIATAPWDAGFLLAVSSGAGLARSQAGGQEWSTPPGDFGKVTAIGFGAAAGDPILVGDHLGSVFISTDAGESWQATGGSPGGDAVTTIASTRDATGTFVVFAGTARGGVFYSDDHGATFSRITDSGEEKPIRSIAVSPSFASDGRVFATGWDAGVLCGRMDNSTWRPCGEGLTRDRQSKELGRASFNTVSPSPDFKTDNTLYVAGFDGLFVSRDGGEHWHHLDTLSPFNIIAIGVSPEHAQDSTVVVTNWMWGAFASRDEGRTWAAINRGARDYRRRNGLTCLFDVVFSPEYAEDGTILTSTWWRILKSDDRGRNWRQIVPVEDPEWTSVHHGSMIALSPDFSRDDTAFVGTHTGLVLKSEDRAESFAIIARKNALIGSIEVSPDFAHDKTLFVADTAGVHVSRDAGSAWSYFRLLDISHYLDPFVSPAHPPEEVDARIRGELLNMQKSLAIKLAVPPGYREHGTVFAGTAEGLYRTSDHGQSWSVVATPMFAPDAYIEAVAASPAYEDDRTVIVVARGHGHYISADGGESFTRLSPELDDSGFLLANYLGTTPPFAPVVFSPTFAADRTLYGFAGAHLFKSADGGRSWSELDAPTAAWRDRLHVWYSVLGRRDRYIYGAGAAGVFFVFVAGAYLRRRSRLA